MNNCFLKACVFSVNKAALLYCRLPGAVLLQQPACCSGKGRTEVGVGRMAPAHDANPLPSEQKRDISAANMPECAA